MRMEQGTQEDVGPPSTRQPFQPGFEPLGAEPGGQWGTEGSSSTRGACRAVLRFSQQRHVLRASLGTTRAIGLFTTTGQSRLRGSIGAASAAFPMQRRQGRHRLGKISFRPPSSHAIPPLPASLKKTPLNRLNCSFSSAQCRDKN